MIASLKIADLFCGAGGSSTGAQRALSALGLRMDLVAVNHWNVAVETHTRNHPDARHLCVDAYKTSPREAVPGGFLDLLMASPTCTYFSRARGGKPISHDQRHGRMTPTQVIRWCTDLDVRAVLVENVPEFMEWGPICKRTTRCQEHRWAGPKTKGEICGRPLRAKRGIYFRRWVRRLELLGYRVEHRVLNAADFGDATTRSRFFLIGRKDGVPISWPRPTHSRAGGTSLLDGTTQRWRAAREVIDWSLPGKSIFGRKKPLSPKTLARIYAGAVKFRWPEPFLVILRQHMDGRSLDRPLPTLCTGNHVYLAEPVIAPYYGASGCASVEKPVPSLSGCNHMGLAQPLVMRTAMHQSNALCVRDAGDPLATVTTDGGFAIVLPQRSDAPARSIERPTPAVTTVARIAIAQPFVLAQGSNGAPRATSEPTPTNVTAGRTALIEPFVLSQASGGAPRAVADPVPTIPTEGAHALIAPYYATGAASPVARPLPTVTTRDRFGLVVPVTHHDGSQRARSLEDPLPTVTGAHRGELACIVAAFGERDGQAPRVHSVEDPAPSICATGRVQLAEGVAAPPVYDILFRMLEPRELARAMGFDDGAQRYEFAGNKTEITRQIGNAVCVGQAAALVGAIFASEALVETAA